MTGAGRPRDRFLRRLASRFAGSRLRLGRGAPRHRGLGLVGALPHHGVGLLRACPKEQLAQAANRGVLVFHQVGHVDVRLEDRANQRRVLLVERLLDTAQDLLQLRVVHFDNLRRVSHPATTPGRQVTLTGRVREAGLSLLRE